MYKEEREVLEEEMVEIGECDIHGEVWYSR